MSYEEEQRLLKLIEEVNKELTEARRDLKEAKRRAVDAETRTINSKIQLEKLTEQLRRARNATVKPGESYASYDEEDGN